MRLGSSLKLKHIAWVSGALLASLLLFFVIHSRAKAAPESPSPPVVKVSQVEERDVPVYGEWIGTLAGQVNATIRAQVTGYLLTRDYKEGSYVRKGQLLFQIDPRPFHALLDQARGQLALAQAQLSQNEAQLATAEANQLQSQLNVDKYGPLAQ